MKHYPEVSQTLDGRIKITHYTGPATVKDREGFSYIIDNDVARALYAALQIALDIE